MYRTILTISAFFVAGAHTKDCKLTIKAARETNLKWQQDIKKSSGESVRLIDKLYKS